MIAMPVVSTRVLNEVCAEIKNYFVDSRNYLHVGFFAITDGKIVPSVPMTSSYYRIVGSVLNDGVHRVGDNDLIDEPTFDGAVWVMCPSHDFLRLVADIEAWQDKYDNGTDSVVNSPYQSESFGGYSYTKATGSGSDGSSSITWQNQFAKRLKPYRRLRLLP